MADDLVREMPSEPRRFSDLRPPYHGIPPWLLLLVLPEVGGTSAPPGCGMTRNPRLTGLRFEDFTRLHDLLDLRTGASLQELDFGNAIWVTSVFESLEPLAGLGGLRSLSFNAKRIEDGRTEPLGELTGLEELNIPTNMFTTRQLAWLRARLPDSVKSRSLAPIEQLKDPFEDERGQIKDVLLVGKRKPFLNSVADQARIKKHVDGFWQMVDAFRGDPALKPD